MKSVVKNVLAVSLLSLVSAAVSAQTIKNGEVSGIIASKSVTVPATSSANVFTAPSTGFFILTQACSSVSNMPLSGSTMGEIIRLQGACQTFTPGIVIPAGETLSCYNEYGFAASCVVTGILSKK